MSGIDLPNSNAPAQYEDNSAQGGRAATVEPAEGGTDDPPPVPFPEQAEPAAVFDPGVDHQADLIDEGPIGERSGDSGLIVLQAEEEAADEPEPSATPSEGAEATAQPSRAVADLSEDEDVAAFLASVEADAGAQELAAQADLDLPDEGRPRTFPGRAGRRTRGALRRSGSTGLRRGLCDQPDSSRTRCRRTAGRGGDGATEPGRRRRGLGGRRRTVCRGGDADRAASRVTWACAGRR